MGERREFGMLADKEFLDCCFWFYGSHAYWQIATDCAHPMC